MSLLKYLLALGNIGGHIVEFVASSFFNFQYTELVLMGKNCIS